MARRNPRAWDTVREWTQGADMVSMAAAAVSLAGAVYIPGMLFKDTTTTQSKVFKMLATGGMAIAAGAITDKFVSPKAGQAAFLGGFSGLVVQAIAMYTNTKIGAVTHAPAGLLSAGRAQGVIPTQQRQAEQVTIIRP